MQMIRIIPNNSVANLCVHYQLMFETQWPRWDRRTAGRTSTASPPSNWGHRLSQRRHQQVRKSKCLLSDLSRFDSKTCFVSRLTFKMYFSSRSVNQTSSNATGASPQEYPKEFRHIRTWAPREKYPKKFWHIWTWASSEKHPQKLGHIWLQARFAREETVAQ